MGNGETAMGNNMQQRAAEGIELGSAAARTIGSVYGAPAQPIKQYSAPNFSVLRPSAVLFVFRLCVHVIKGNE